MKPSGASRKVFHLHHSQDLKESIRLQSEPGTSQLGWKQQLRWRFPSSCSQDQAPGRGHTTVRNRTIFILEISNSAGTASFFKWHISWPPDATLSAF
jgi:hypothetical protein